MNANSILLMVLNGVKIETVEDKLTKEELILFKGMAKQVADSEKAGKKIIWEVPWDV